MFTFAAVGFTITCLAVLSSVIESFSVGSFSIAFQKPDSVLILGFLASTFTAYVTRRNKKDQLESDEIKESMRVGNDKD